MQSVYCRGAGTAGAGWASSHRGKNQGGLWMESLAVVWKLHSNSLSMSVAGEQFVQLYSYTSMLLTRSQWHTFTFTRYLIGRCDANLRNGNNYYLLIYSFFCLVFFCTLVYYNCFRFVCTFESLSNCKNEDEKTAHFVQVLHFFRKRRNEKARILSLVVRRPSALMLPLSCSHRPGVCITRPKYKATSDEIWDKWLAIFHILTKLNYLSTLYVCTSVLRWAGWATVTYGRVGKPKTREFASKFRNPASALQSVTPSIYEGNKIGLICSKSTYSD